MNKSKFFCILGILLVFGFTNCNKDSEKIVIKTNTPQEVSSHYARMTGSITSSENNIELWAYGYCLGKEPNPDMSQMQTCIYAVDPSHPDVSLPRPFDWVIPGLDPGTEYHFRAFAFITSNERPIFGEDVCFTTSGK